ncbi:conserved hypothetical protein [Perkinsus marinus ATCC 50983]|uniref:C2 domain-containing protein n=1 Tax=Perkinsus marinus (strain ATCC 50983 / TXsc) TaxID=423536 RepID=C5LFX5_PERM5|nr:conserved hypothetical protein [Perkinsus marinus ATCC 50983]EER04356.1 conserved hypothetical protein [Perkinsus marinus ATCC 50983]|eukprot:XP_002772540.1 conserved hypothetical protein [Perkinsus marinus ATCC 50983]
MSFPEKPGDVRGYVNVSVGIYGPGDDVPSGFRLISDEDEAVSSITERVLQTPDSKFNLVMLNFNVYKAENLPKKGGGGVFGRTATCSPYVIVSFAGVKLQTKVIVDNSRPVWNECLRVPVMCPTWDQNVLIEIMSQGDRNEMIAAADFDFQAIYDKGMQTRWVNLYYSFEGEEPPPQVNDEPLESE